MEPDGITENPKKPLHEIPIPKSLDTENLPSPIPPAPSTVWGLMNRYYTFNQFWFGIFLVACGIVFYFVPENSQSPINKEYLILSSNLAMENARLTMKIVDVREQIGWADPKIDGGKIKELQNEIETINQKLNQNKETIEELQSKNKPNNEQALIGITYRRTLKYLLITGLILWGIGKIWYYFPGRFRPWKPIVPSR